MPCLEPAEEVRLDDPEGKHTIWVPDNFTAREGLKLAPGMIVGKALGKGMQGGVYELQDEKGAKLPRVLKVVHGWAPLANVKREWEVGRRLNSTAEKSQGLDGFMAVGRAVRTERSGKFKGMILERLHGTNADKILGGSHFHDIDYVRDMLLQVFTSLDAAQRAWGFHHADFRLGNVMEITESDEEDQAQASAPSAASTAASQRAASLTPAKSSPLHGERRGSMQPASSMETAGSLQLRESRRSATYKRRGPGGLACRVLGVQCPPPGGAVAPSGAAPAAAGPPHLPTLPEATAAAPPVPLNEVAAAAAAAQAVPAAASASQQPVQAASVPMPVSPFARAPPVAEEDAAAATAAHAEGSGAAQAAGAQQRSERPAPMKQVAQAPAIAPARERAHGRGRSPASDADNDSYEGESRAATALAAAGAPAMHSGQQVLDARSRSPLPPPPGSSDAHLQLSSEYGNAGRVEADAVERMTRSKGYHFKIIDFGLANFDFRYPLTDDPLAADPLKASNLNAEEEKKAPGGVARKGGRQARARDAVAPGCLGLKPLPLPAIPLPQDLIPKVSLLEMIYRRAWRRKGDVYHLLRDLATCIDGQVWPTEDRADVLRLAAMIQHVTGVKLRAWFVDHDEWKKGPKAVTDELPMGARCWPLGEYERNDGRLHRLRNFSILFQTWFNAHNPGLTAAEVLTSPFFHTISQPRRAPSSAPPPAPSTPPRAREG